MNLKKRSQQIHSTTVTSVIVGREKPKGLSADYIVGLTDAEGCFYVNIRVPNSTHKYRVEMHFYIKLREDDLSLLKKVQNFFKCGGVYLQREYRVNQRNCYRFGVTAQKDLHEKIIPFFDEHQLQSRKIKNYLLFREIAMIVKKKDHMKSNGLKRAQQLKMQMNLGARWMPEIGSSSGNSELTQATEIRPSRQQSR